MAQISSKYLRRSKWACTFFMGELSEVGLPRTYIGQHLTVIARSAATWRSLRLPRYARNDESGARNDKLWRHREARSDVAIAWALCSWCRALTRHCASMAEMRCDQIHAFKGEEIEVETQAEMLARYQQSL